MAKLDMSIKVTDLPAFNLLIDAAPAWIEQVTQPGYEATNAEKLMFGAIMAIADNKEDE